jgi:F-type H+-transporting ATPase subunit gamma
MAKPRELRRRIRSVQSTRKITKTMELVATSKLKRAQDRVVAARPYAAALTDVIGDLYAPELAERFPLLRQPAGPDRRVALLLITSNRGLCGAFNANLIREARRRIEELERAGAAVDLHLVGKKGITYFKFTKRPLASQRVDIGDKPTTSHAAELVTPLAAQFESGALDAVELVFAQFKSAVSSLPTTLRILPVTPPRVEPGKVGRSEHSNVPTFQPSPFYILKPSAEAIVEQLLPLYVRNQVYRALVETTAAFYGAQRVAMKNATDNAGDMLDQTQITQELAEIVGGAEALKG